MAFVDAGAYDRFMGRFSEPLAARFANWAALPPAPATVLDVGCGPGALTAELAARYDARSVRAADPSEPFVTATRARLPQVEVLRAPAEALPWPDDSVDATLAQLVVSFMSDPVAGLREAARVTRPGGVVAACVWDLAGGRAPLSPLWAAAARVAERHGGGAVDDESGMPGARAGHLAEMFEAAGLHEVTDGEVGVTLRFATFEEWWAPFLLGVGPAGDHVASLDDAAREELAAACREVLPPAPFDQTVVAWAARGTA